MNSFAIKLLLVENRYTFIFVNVSLSQESTFVRYLNLNIIIKKTLNNLYKINEYAVIENTSE